jgi:hypothetical protein
MTDTGIQPIDYVAHQGMKVTFKLNQEVEGVVEVRDMEGTVELVVGEAMLFKPKGSAMHKLVELKNIVAESFEVIPEVPRELKPKSQGVVGLTNARNHLLDRHERELTVINAMDDKTAFDLHELIDHDNLGHFHGPKQEAAES